MKRKSDPLKTLRDLVKAHRQIGERTDVNATMRVALLTGLNVQTLAHYLSGRRKIGVTSAEMIRHCSSLLLHTLVVRTKD